MIIVMFLIIAGFVAAICIVVAFAASRSEKRRAQHYNDYLRMERSGRTEAQRVEAMKRSRQHAMFNPVKSRYADEDLNATLVGPQSLSIFDSPIQELPITPPLESSGPDRYESTPTDIDRGVAESSYSDNGGGSYDSGGGSVDCGGGSSGD